MAQFVYGILITTNKFNNSKKIYNLSITIFNGHTKRVCGIEFSPFNGGKYLCSGSADNTIRLWDVETSKSLHVFNEHKNDILCVDISPLQSNNKNDNNNEMNNIG
ncbi:heat shock protein DnaJ domain-containing protein, partial [Reticulomyxa filosa]